MTKGQAAVTRLDASGLGGARHPYAHQPPSTMPTVFDFRRPALTAVLALSAGCAGVTGPHDGASAAPMLAALPRALTGAERSVILASNDFSLSLLRTVSGAAKDSNVFISPLSASMALGM